MRINMQSGWVHYLVGLCVNLAFLGVLLVGDASYRNLQLPEGQYVNNKNDASRSDVMAYVGLARNYREHGVFGVGSEPTDYRVVGYPAFLAAMMVGFGEHWVLGAYLVQALLLAGIYPALLVIGKVLFRGRHHGLGAMLCFCLVSGTYFARTPIFTSDLLFTGCFLGGICFGMLAVARQSWVCLGVQLVLLGCGAQVRPVLGMYPIVHLLVLVATARLYPELSRRKTRWLIGLSIAGAAVLCNTPSLRNYINRGHWQPATMIGTRMTGYVARPILLAANEPERIEQFEAKLAEAKTREARGKLWREYVIGVVKDYPGQTLACLGRFTTDVMAYSHWFDIAAFWGDYSKRTELWGYRPFESRFVIVAIKMLWNVVYLVIYLGCLFFLVRLLREKKVFFVVTLVLFLSYMLIPTFIGGGGPRMRLPVEGIMVMFAFYEIARIRFRRVLRL